MQRLAQVRRFVMPVNVNHLVSEVDVEAEPDPQPSQHEAVTPWQEVERVRAAQAQLLEDWLRTRAEGFDD